LPGIQTASGWGGVLETSTLGSGGLTITTAGGHPNKKTTMPVRRSNKLRIPIFLFITHPSSSLTLLERRIKPGDCFLFHYKKTSKKKKIKISCFFSKFQIRK